MAVSWTSEDKQTRAAELAQIRTELEHKVRTLTTSDEWCEALRWAARFHRYSLHNILWLQLQAAQRDMTITQVAGFRRWTEQGRQVRKGEKSLRVLAPSRYKVTADDGTDKWIIRGFTTAAVFDISQTDGPPIPDVAPQLLTGDSPHLRHLIDQVASQLDGWRLEWVSGADRGRLLGAANGSTDPTHKVIRVRADVSDAQQLKTLVHEWAHATLHSDVNYAALRDRCEVEAESVAYVVLTALGVEADSYSIGYVAGWSHGDGQAIQDTAETVVKAAHQLLDQLPTASLAAA